MSPDVPTTIPGVDLAERNHPDTHLLIWQVRGRSELGSRGVTLAIAQGLAVWVPAGISCSLTVAPDAVALPMFFEARDTAGIFDEITLLVIDPHAEPLCLAYVAAEFSDLGSTRELGRRLLATIANRGITASELPLPADLAARRVAEGLLRDPGDTRTVAEWAANVHVSPRTLERAFVRETGVSIRRWRARCRMNAAKRMLAQGVAVWRVATTLGYRSHSAFSAAFRAEVGVAPSAYATVERPLTAAASDPGR